MTEKFDAKVEQAGGALKEGLGKLTGDKATQAEGMVEKVAGKAKEVASDIKETAKGMVSGLTKDKEE